jgi:HAD superfamily hydrolase (TIGR01549 family)
VITWSFYTNITEVILNIGLIVYLVRVLDLFEAVIFDLHGTLIEFNIDIKSMSREMYSYVSKTMYGSYFDFSERAARYFIRLVEIRPEVGDDVYRELWRGLHTIACRYEVEAAKEASLIEGALSILGFLRGIDVRMGVASNSCLDAVKLSLEKVGILGYFEALVAREDVDRVKPYPDLVVEAVDRLGVERGRCIYIGDSPIDVASGLFAGVYTIFIDSGRFPPLEGFPSNPDIRVKNLRELGVVLEGFLGG